MRQLALPALLLAAGLLTQCRHRDPDPTKPEDQLPPATQTGAGTFGCLLNGQPWTPSGNLNIPNFFVIYDPTYRGGNLDIRTYRLFNNSANRQYFSFGGDGISQTGTYAINVPVGSSSAPYTVYFSDDSKSAPCNFYNLTPSMTTTTGYFTITRLDKQQGVIAGTFEFKLAQPGCDTVRVTQGRFDYKL